MRIYIDGACKGNPGPGGWAYVIEENGELTFEMNGHLDLTTNNRAELNALIAALRYAEKGQSLTIITDSNNVIGWMVEGWKRKDPHIDALVTKAKTLIKERELDVTFEAVKAHAGNPGNERADKLASWACVPKI